MWERLAAARSTTAVASRFLVLCPEGHCLVFRRYNNKEKAKRDYRIEKPCDHKLVAQTIDEACARKHEQDKRIRRAASKVFSRFEQVMVDVTFAEAGQLGTTKEVPLKK